MQQNLLSKTRNCCWQSGRRRCLAEKHSRVTLDAHPLCAESVRKMVVPVGVLLDEGVEAVDVASRASVHWVREAVERRACSPALAGDVSLPTVAAVDGTKDGLDDLVAASTRGWGGKFKLRGVKIVRL